MIRSDGFKKVDLHIHTPKSACYGDKSATMEQIVDAALAGGLAAIAVTDHNTIEAIDEIRSIAGQKGLIIIPGVELSTKGGHCVALFETDSTIAKLKEFLQKVRVDPAKPGDGTALTGDSFEEALPIIAECGGVAIAAHIERWPSGFLETSEPRSVKKNIHSSPYLSALEITIPQNKLLWNTGQVRDFPTKHACIQSSDAHRPSEIGRRPVFIQMEDINLPALTLAFSDFENKIVFPDGD
jgi:PHP family Zn ribbon phosphoesterase